MIDQNTGQVCEGVFLYDVLGQAWIPLRFRTCPSLPEFDSLAFDYPQG